MGIGNQIGVFHIASNFTDMGIGNQIKFVTFFSLELDNIFD